MATTPASILCAQASAQTGAGRAFADALCWRGRPLPACRSFLVTELGGHKRLLTPSETRVSSDATGLPYSETIRPGKDVVAFDGGAMMNVGRRNAIGLTASVAITEGTASTHPWIGGRVRYRYWLTPSGMSVDVGAGLESRGSLYYRERQRHVGFTSDVAINARDHVAAFVRFDQVRLVEQTKPSVSIGVRTGAQLGFFAALGTAVTAGAVAIALKDAFR